MMQTLKDVYGDVIVETQEYFVNASDFLKRALTTTLDFSGADFVTFVKQWPKEYRNLNYIDFTDADLSECHGAGLDFSNCNFSRVNLRDANFRSTLLINCIFSGTIMDAANFHDADLSKSEFIEYTHDSLKPRHPLRPQTDEFLPFDRVLARSANFTNSILQECLITNGNFVGSIFENTDISQSLIEKSDFEGALFISTDFSDSIVYRNDLVSPTLCYAKSESAIFRNNNYIEFPVPKTIATASFSFPRQFFGYIKEEFNHWKNMPREIKTDYQRVFFIKLLVLLMVPLLAVLVWKFVETNSLLKFITTIGAISIFALRRYFIMLFQSFFEFIFGKVNDAEGLWKTGYRGQKLVKLLTSSSIMEKLYNFRNKTSS